VHALAFNPAGNLLASSGYREVKLWRRVSEVAPLAPPLAPGHEIRLAVASPDGRWLAGGGPAGVITVWHASDRSVAGHFTNATPDVSAIAFSTAGTRLASASGSKHVQVWDVESGARIAALDTPADVRALAWLGDETRMATGESDHMIRLWEMAGDAAGGIAPLKEFQGHEGPVTVLARVDPEGRQLLSGSEDGSVKLWDIAEGKAIRTLDQGGPVTGLAVRGDGKRFASAGRNNTAKIWNAEDGKQVAELKGDRYALESVAALDRGKTLSTADVAFRKGDLESAEKDGASQAERVKKAVEAFEPAEKAYADNKKAAEDALQAKDLEEKTLAELHLDITRVTEAFQTADSAAKQIEKDAKHFVTIATQSTSSEERSQLDKQEAEAFLAEAQRLADRSRVAASMSSLSVEEKAAAEQRAADAESVVAKARMLAESAKGGLESQAKAAADARAQADRGIEQVAARAFAAGLAKVEFDRVTQGVDERLKKATNTIAEAAKKIQSTDKEFKKAELEKSKTETELDLARKAEASGSKRIESAKTDLAAAEAADQEQSAALDAGKAAAAAGEQPMTAVAFFEDGSKVATASADGRIQTWTADNGLAIEVYAYGDKPVTSLAFFGPRRFMAASDGPADQSAREIHEAWVLDRVIGTGGEDSPMVDRVDALAFSPDGALLATGGGEPSRSGEIKVWRVADGTLAKDLPRVHSDTVLSLEFSPDGARIASGAADKFARITRWNSGEVEQVLEGHTHHVMGVAWKADGRTLATSGADHAIKVWDAVKGERKKNIQGFDKEITSIEFVGVTDQAVVCSGDNRVRMLKEDGNTVRDFGSVEDFQHAVAVTPDGLTVVAGGEASVLRAWNGKDGKVLAAFPSE
jgi:WD40 repeat protein